MASVRWRISWAENVVFAFTAMREQKLRSFLTLLGVVAGVATVIMMVSFVVGFNNQVVSSFTQFGTYLVQFQKYEPRFGGEHGPRFRSMGLEVLARGEEFLSGCKNGLDGPAGGGADLPGPALNRIVERYVKGFVHLELLHRMAR